MRILKRNESALVLVAFTYREGAKQYKPVSRVTAGIDNTGCHYRALNEAIRLCMCRGQYFRVGFSSGTLDGG